MNDLFEQAVGFVLAHEGGLAQDPDDPGGRTNFGISHRAYPSLQTAALTETEARKIYRRDYWLRLSCPRLPGLVALTLLDTAVNCGPSRAALWLQISSNEASEKAGRAGLKLDGIIGEKTIARVAGQDPARLVLGLLGRRLDHYAGLAAGRQSKYLRGWTRRVADLMLLLERGV